MPSPDFQRGKNMEQQRIGGCIKNPQGILSVAKSKTGHRSVQTTRRIQPILDVVTKVRINPLSVLRIATKSSGVIRAEKQQRDEAKGKLNYNGPKTFEEEIKKSEQAKPSMFDTSNCLAVKGGGEE